MEWIEVAEGVPYFQTESGAPWAPIGQNDAISWVDLHGLFRRRDMAPVESYLAMLAAHGVTCLRLMMEYSQVDHRFMEQPAGVFKPAMVQLWDDLFRLCEQYGLRVLLTPFDTFWMWKRWKKHPYNRANGGPCASPRELLTCRATRAAIKARLAFAIERWGGGGALFAWDLWNEIHPAHAGNSAECFREFIDDIGGFAREREEKLYGRSHPQTVSVFLPHVSLDPARISDAVFRHPALDFASAHFYEEGTLDDPRDTVAPAAGTGRLVRECLAEIRDERPFLDSEHGPIHTFKDHHKTLPEAFDDEYFRHVQWAHFASGAAGGGMRWPNRSPHRLTAGMRVAQRNLAGFLPLMAWRCFRRRNWNAEVRAEGPVKVFACGDARQAVVWLLRKDTIGRDGRLKRDADATAVAVETPEMAAGTYCITAWDTAAGTTAGEVLQTHMGGPLRFTTPGFRTDVALAIRAE